MEEEVTPLERRLESFGVRIASWFLLLCAVLMVEGLIAQGLGRWTEVLLFAVAPAVAAVPEGPPAIMTLTLALGVERMAARKAVVRLLAAVEALGSVTAILTDKQARSPRTGCRCGASRQPTDLKSYWPLCSPTMPTVRPEIRSTSLLPNMRALTG